MKIRSGWGTVCAWALAACGDLAVQPTSRSMSPTPTSTVALSCDRTWVGSTSGDWADPARWSPAGEPELDDVVCFGSGTYTVDIPLGARTGAVAEEIRFLPGSTVTLDGSAGCAGTLAYLFALQLSVEPGATATAQECLEMTISGVTWVDGTLALRTNPMFTTSTLVAFGVVDLVDQSVFVNTSGPLSVAGGGEIRLTGANTLTANSKVSVSGGSVTGSGHLRVYASTGSSVEWMGGSFPARSAVGTASVSFSATSIALGTTGSGALDIEAPPLAVTLVKGHHSSAKDVAIVPMPAFPFGGTVFLEPPVGSAPNTSVLLAGTLAVKNVALESTYDVRNTGTLLFQRAASNPGLSVNRMRGTTFHNEGQLSVFDSTRIEDVVVSNIGTIRTWGAAGHVVLAGGSYAVDPAGSMVGRLSLEAGGALSGNGTLDQVVSAGGVVSPGSATAPYGALTFADLTLDAASQVDIDVGGLSSLDRVTATTRLALAGALKVRTNAPFVGGLCGQVVSPLGTTRGATLTGGFAQYIGTSLTTTRRWRPYLSPTSLSLVGHDPSRVMGVSSPQVAVSESGNVATTQLCFSGIGPTANVTVTPTARFGQSAAAPSPLVVTPGAWALPHTLTVSAINDLVAEPTHSDSLRFQLTSTDGFYNGPMQQQVAVNITDNDPPVDLTVSLVSANPPQTVGQGMERRFRVSNLGPGASTGSTFSIGSLAGATFTWSSVGTACAVTSGTLQCTVAAIPAGGFIEFVVVFTASTTPGTYTNTLRIRGNDYDNVNANNTAPWVLTVN